MINSSFLHLLTASKLRIDEKLAEVAGITPNSMDAHDLTLLKAIKETRHSELKAIAGLLENLIKDYVNLHYGPEPKL